ncbi:NAD-dependent epimerase/dehydratase [Nocardia sp. CDC159]|uniref:NAD-dependent epimerase/dehydratase n=1 Tax=Nocardia pulmonis TaxID=2951408 RepID=A0A9X2EII3_9NOCA|nr:MULTISPECIES: NAD-dependent epimerase/dehydratase [Nocardia]MCM6778696.1 NAD-dependent epimerase/dehydratase [Nocardia pulmonis]MCM6791585.1 NAD-dependent epimerase/dehydratase [Nocardia sp. CDC159]
MAVKPLRYTLLGATGFVGSAVLRELAAHPIRLRAVARHPVAVPTDAAAVIDVDTQDLTAPGAVARAVADADVVVHCVAYIAGTTTWRIAEGDDAAERVTVGTVADLVEALGQRSHPARVVFAGAVSQVGSGAREIVDGTEIDRPTGEYDRQKLRAERLLLDGLRSGPHRAVSVRLPTVFGYGPHSTARDKGVVSTMVRRALAGQPLTMWHDGTVRRDVLYVEDVARALAAAADHADELAGRAWVLGSGRGLALKELFGTIADLVAERTGTRVPVVSVPPPEHAEAGDLQSLTVDSSAFRAATGWQPMVDLETALRRTIEFCAAEQLLSERRPE